MILEAVKEEGIAVDSVEELMQAIENATEI